MDHFLFSAALVVGFYMAWNIGANDVANAFGTSVGSGAVTFRRALLLAAICEFAGAYLVGANVSDTIKSGIVATAIFADQPLAFEVGMLSALLAASLWLNLATYLGQPVSTTHAIIGAVIGFGVVFGGAEVVQWHKMIRIAASWVVSPVVGGALACAIYLLVQRFVLRAARPVHRAQRTIPLGVAAVLLIVWLSVSHEWGARVGGGRFAPWLARWALPSGLGLAAAAGLAAHAFLRWRVARRPWLVTEGAGHLARVERWFGFLQIMTACYMSFAHGANDVANAIGPVAGFLQARRGLIAARTVIPSWVLLLGGTGIVIGLATYGYKVMQAVGHKITEVTPTRGFSAEFGTATTVLVCSLLGLPISTTFVLVGAVMGVGFARGFGAIDLGVVKKIFLSWLITIPFCAVLSGVLYGLIMTILRRWIVAPA